MTPESGHRIGTGIVIGYGSVGKRHARTLAALAPSLVIVEPRAEARLEATTNHPEAVTTGDLRACDAAGVRWPDALAVIATWGPSHAAMFHELADRGVRRILCEKPIAASVADAAEMERRAAREGITLGVHHYIRYAGLVPALLLECARHGLGEPVAVVVEGGAACLLTNGIHWLDFAAELFRVGPISVVSSASGAPINPRSPDLHLYGGTAVWSFPGGREAVITFSNRSSVALGARVYFRDAVADIAGDLTVTIRRRDPEAVRAFPAVTRTGPAAEQLFQGPLPGVMPYLDGMRAAAEDVARGQQPLCPGSVGAAAVSACIGALVAAREGRSVALPLDPSGAWADEHWPIS